jgi:hypothetical protein
MRREDGGIITGWLGQLLIFMAVVGLLGYDVVAVVTTAVALEDEAREVASDAADAYGYENDLIAGEEAAQASAEREGVELVEFWSDGAYVRVRVTRQAGTLWAHLIPPLRDLTRPTATGRGNWRL